jgi:hypothetical protein
MIMEHPYMYIFVRQDLTLPQQIVQASHAAHEAGHDFGKADGSTHIVLIGIPSQAKLLATADHLDSHKIPYKMFFEPDYDTGYTAIATQPLFGDQRTPLRKFRLMEA